MTTMKNIRIATAQFEHRNGDKAWNLSRIDELAGRAARAGADAVAFHECSVTGYAFARKLSREAMLALAEPVPGGPSIEALRRIAARHGLEVLAGLFEVDEARDIYKAYVCVDGTGLKARYRKLHPFINPHIRPGQDYVVFDLKGWKCGILICYDNNIVENVRATALLGAQVIFMPHVTMCTPSPRPGAGFVDPALWARRREDPTSLRAEFDGLKGRAWLMKWLPARAYDNGVYVVFSNAIGMDDDQLKNGCSMVLDPFGDILAECRALDDDIAVATCVPGKLVDAGGYRYRLARRPELYRSILGQEHRPEQKVVWLGSGPLSPCLGEVLDPEEKSQICKRILADLPLWFGIPEATAEYCRGVREHRFFSIRQEGQLVGFISVRRNNPQVAELYVLGILAAWHRQGLGSRALAELFSLLAAEGFRYLEVKTLDETRDSEEYRKTRLFYLKQGFVPLDVLRGEWGEANPCLVMIKAL